MKIELLQLQLYPRPNAHALDLGFSLLRQNAGEVYKVWLFFWLTLNLLAGLFAYAFPTTGMLYLFLPWFFRPLIERAPLYILSRQVFGEHVTWRQAVRAWPSQLGGGWFRMLTWWRIFVPGRGLFQAIYQLEGMRGADAAVRRRLIGKKTTASANWFGIVCAHFETGVQLALWGTIAIFMHEQFGRDPWDFITGIHGTEDIVLSLVFNIISVGIIGPIYVACCFTLYLNRRATLEAWDVELMLRQVQKPVQTQLKKPSKSTAHSVLIAVFLVLPLVALHSNDSVAANKEEDKSSVEKLHLDKCSPPENVQQIPKQRGESHTAQQEQMRQQLDRLYQSEKLVTYFCKEQLVDKNKKEKNKKSDSNFNLDAIAGVFKIVFIAIGAGLLIWLLYRYREKFTGIALPERRSRALEIAGLNIRADSLPDDVCASVLQLWRNGEHRAALALLYRATLSHLVEQDALYFEVGSTEGDCLSAIRLAARQQNLNQARATLAQQVSELWQNAAYAHRFPESMDVLSAVCAQWHAEFEVQSKVNKVEAQLDLPRKPGEAV
jgi:hypothetical protein